MHLHRGTFCCPFNKEDTRPSIICWGDVDSSSNSSRAESICVTIDILVLSHKENEIADCYTILLLRAWLNSLFFVLRSLTLCGVVNLYLAVIN